MAKSVQLVKNVWISVNKTMTKTKTHYKIGYSGILIICACSKYIKTNSKHKATSDESKVTCNKYLKKIKK